MERGGSLNTPDGIIGFAVEQSAEWQLLEFRYYDERLQRADRL